MGPRPSSRGDSGSTWPRPSWTSCFKGAATFQSRRREAHVRTSRRCRYFKGVTTIQSRRHDAGIQPRPGGDASMEPRPFSRRDMISTTSLLIGCLLQWSRDHSVAETRRWNPAPTRWRRFNGAATIQSRRPGQMEGPGDHSASERPCAPAAKASMEPRPFSRGDAPVLRPYFRVVDWLQWSRDHSVAEEILFFVSVSLQWSRDHSVAETYRRIGGGGQPRLRLQWSRDHSVAETRRPVRDSGGAYASMEPRPFSDIGLAPPGGNSASMEPRPFSRGDLVEARLPGGPRSLTGFNGAATIQSRRRHVATTSGWRSRQICFNGAATIQSRRLDTGKTNEHTFATTVLQWSRDHSVAETP